ncbi:MAG TPA: NAD(P)-binding domain-containing protein [Amnibacterium sp.]|jgi:putative flavoprotein involved in K+ transport|uniref:NAD(P)-binding domain-containing protein n=1 Tax=Amnibacterium sp. TaxID=1872496 RepID=UPI002F92321E
MRRIETVVIGAGQAGLSVSHELAAAGLEHVVLERGKVAQRWRDRWDGFHLVLPNCSIRLAGQGYGGSDPEGFLPRDGVVELLADYAASFASPIEDGVEVHALQATDDGFRLDTTTGPLAAERVIVATGGYQDDHRPAAVRSLPASVPVLASSAYRRPNDLPETGTVVVVGSGQSGCQIAEELHDSGREVVLACGKAPWEPRRVGGRDIFWWLDGTPFMEMTLEDLPSPLARLSPNPQVSGTRGGRDLNYRTLQDGGIRLAGHLMGEDHRSLRFAPDLADSVAFGDARYADIRGLVEMSARAKGLPAPEMPDPSPWHAEELAELPLAEVGAVVVAAGYRPTYRSWIDIPVAFDAMGFPLQKDGTSDVVPHLHFAGVPFQRTRTSATLCGAGADATALVDAIAQRDPVGVIL